MIDHNSPRRYQTDVVHPDVGRITPPFISTIDAFRPERWLTDPGNLVKLKKLARRRYALSMGVRSNARRWQPGELLSAMPPKIRQAAMERAEDVVVCRFLDADYAALGITDDEPVRAVLVTLRWCERSGFRDVYGGSDGSRQGSRVSEPHSGSMSGRGDNPATISATVETAARYRRYDSEIQRDIARDTAREAIVGRGVECQIIDDDGCHVVYCEGGREYRETRVMVATMVRYSWMDSGQPTTIDPDTGESIPRYRRVERKGGWKMVIGKSHHHIDYRPGIARIVGDDRGNGVEFVG